MSSIEHAALPQAVYGCANMTCAEERSFSADHLNWVAAVDPLRSGFYCFDCADDEQHDGGSIGPSLAFEITRRQRCST